MSATSNYPKAPSAIKRTIKAGDIMTNWKGTKFEVINTDLVPCTVDSIVVREVGDKYPAYYPCEFLRSESEKEISEALNEDRINDIKMDLIDAKNETNY